VGDLEEVGDLFLDAKASAKILTEQAAKYLS
jgi:RuvB-like protein 1 (pontin 52)